VKTTPDISFVILSWNSQHFLDGCVNSLKDDLQHSGLTYEVLLIDNGSRDGSLEKLSQFQAEGHPLIVIPLGNNTGTTFSRNIGLRMARGKYICILDSDIRFCDPDTMTTLIDVLEEKPNAGILSPTLRYPSGNHQKSFDHFPTIVNKLERLFFLRSIERKEGLRSLQAKSMMEVDYTISAFWLFRRDLMGKIGLLDENIFYAPEDVDYCLRSWLGGYPVLFCNHVEVIHLAQEISRKKPFSKSAWRHVQGLAYFFRKYKYCLGLKRVRSRIHLALETRAAEALKTPGRVRPAVKVSFGSKVSSAP